MKTIEHVSVDTLTALVRQLVRAFAGLRSAQTVREHMEARGQCQGVANAIAAVFPVPAPTVLTHAERIIDAGRIPRLRRRRAQHLEMVTDAVVAQLVSYHPPADELF